MRVDLLDLAAGARRQRQRALELRPRLVEIDAPGWAVTGVKPNGVPEAQVFFARQQAAVDAGARAPKAPKAPKSVRTK